MNKSAHGKARPGRDRSHREEGELVVNVFQGGFSRRRRKEAGAAPTDSVCWIQSVAGTAVNNDAPGQQDAKLMSVSG